MNKEFKFVITLVVMCCFMMGCKHKTDVESLPSVRYKFDIAPIISSNCTFSGCHGDTLSERFKLLTYDDVIKHCDVVANSPESSKLYSIIKTYDEEKIMPKKPYNSLTEKQIQLIYVWIGQGAKNN